MLTNSQKRHLEQEMLRIISQNVGGINTRTLISQTLNNISAIIPNVNRYHAAGMIAWLITAYNRTLITRTPGYSVIA